MCVCVGGCACRVCRGVCMPCVWGGVHAVFVCVCGVHAVFVRWGVCVYEGGICVVWCVFGRSVQAVWCGGVCGRGSVVAACVWCVVCVCGF